MKRNEGIQVNQLVRSILSRESWHKSQSDRSKSRASEKGEVLPPLPFDVADMLKENNIESTKDIEVLDCHDFDPPLRNLDWCMHFCSLKVLFLHANAISNLIGIQVVFLKMLKKRKRKEEGV